MNYILEPLPYKKAKRLYQCFDTDKIIKDSKAFYGVISDADGYKVVKDAIQSEYNLGYLFGFDSASKGVDIEDLDFGQNTAEYKNGVFKAYRDVLSKEDLAEPVEEGEEPLEQSLPEEGAEGSEEEPETEGEEPEEEEPETEGEEPEEEEFEGLEDSFIPVITHSRLKDTLNGRNLTFVSKKPQRIGKGAKVYKINDSKLYVIVDNQEFIESEQGTLQFLQNQGPVDLYITNDGEIVEVPHTDTESEDVQVQGRDVPLYELRTKFSKEFLLDHPPFTSMSNQLWNQAIDQFNGRALFPIAVMKRYNQLKKNGRNN